MDNDNINKALISASLMATMAYLATDGMSGITDEQVETMRRRYRRVALDDIGIGIEGLHPTINPARVVEIRWQDECEMNAMLAAPGIDFDIFDISNEDAWNSGIFRRIAAGNPIFGYQYEHPTDLSDEWLDDEYDHGRWDVDDDDRADDLNQSCRNGDCGWECKY